MGHEDPPTRFELFVRWCQNHPFICGVLILGLSTILLARVIDAGKTVKESIVPHTASGIRYELSVVRASVRMEEEAEWTQWSEQTYPGMGDGVKGEDPHTFVTVAAEVPDGAEILDVAKEGGSQWGRWEGEDRDPHEAGITVSARYKSWYEHSGKARIRVKFRRRTTVRETKRQQLVSSTGEICDEHITPPGSFTAVLGDSYESYDLRLFTTSGVWHLTPEEQVVKSASTSIDPTQPGVLRLTLGEPTK